jgi:hypothetical protein
MHADKANPKPKVVINLLPVFMFNLGVTMPPLSVINLNGN